MQKKGVELVGKNLVGIIIVVIGILIILAVIAVMLRTYWGEASLEKAAGSLDYFIDALKSIKEGESKIITMTTPQNWWLVYFEENENINKEYFEKPSNLFGKKALCICKGRVCDSRACKEISMPVRKDNSSLTLKIKIMDLEVTNRIEYYEVRLLEQRVKYKN
ncbi:MAG: hypothetical protein QXP53_01495 [Candidatus Pacearchaeota archaeon]